MSTRVHTCEASAIRATITDSSQFLVEWFGAEFAGVPVPCLVIEDAGNQEAWVFTGPMHELAQLGSDLTAKVIGGIADLADGDGPFCGWCNGEGCKSCGFTGKKVTE